MTIIDETSETQGTTLCKTCGLCCTGHLFIWAKLRPAELDPAEALGLHVYRSDPNQRGFSQPCPLWQGQCTVYASPLYPHVCRAYKCKLLKEVLGENTPLPEALTVVEQAKEMIREVEGLLPSSTRSNFRERLVAQIESLDTSARKSNAQTEFRAKTEVLLAFYKEYFGVDDLVEKPDEKGQD